MVLEAVAGQQVLPSAGTFVAAGGAAPAAAAEVMLATHNRESVELAVAEMARLGLAPSGGDSDEDALNVSSSSSNVSGDVSGSVNGGVRVARGRVYFGQLLGMADALTFTLGHHGYCAYKYVPYGAVHEVIPYLLRRAHENQDMLRNGAGSELAALRAELGRRLGSVLGMSSRAPGSGSTSCGDTASTATVSSTRGAAAGVAG